MIVYSNSTYYALRIQSVEEGIWNVRSQTGLSEDGYSVIAKELIAKDAICTLPGCNIKCTNPECGFVCRHMYSCECYDYANGHICKHIHAVCIHINAVSGNTRSSGNPVPLTYTPTPSEKENIISGM